MLSWEYRTKWNYERDGHVERMPGGCKLLYRSLKHVQDLRALPRTFARTRSTALLHMLRAARFSICTANLHPHQVICFMNKHLRDEFTTLIVDSSRSPQSICVPASAKVAATISTLSLIGVHVQHIPACQNVSVARAEVVSLPSQDLSSTRLGEIAPQPLFSRLAGFITQDWPPQGAIMIFLKTKICIKAF